jgi:hypothetical protein
VKKTNDTVVVYWSLCSTSELYYQLLMLDCAPESFISNLHKRKVVNNKMLQNPNAGRGKYQTCSAMHTFGENLFILKSPIEAEIYFDENGNIDRSTRNNHFFIERESSFENSKCFDFDLQYLFFSEENMNITLTPAYMHKALHNDHGFLLGGQFDISSWFRAIPTIFQSWEGKNNFKVGFNDPLSYVHFDTNKKIEFKQFRLNEELTKQVQACSKFQNLLRFQPMNKLYARFKNAGMKEMVLNEIKANLV